MAKQSILTSLLDRRVRLHFGIDLNDAEQVKAARATSSGWLRLTGDEAHIVTVYLVDSEVWYTVKLANGALMDCKSNYFNVVED